MSEWEEAQRYMGVWQPEGDADDVLLQQAEARRREQFAKMSSSDASVDFPGLFRDWAEKADTRLQIAELDPRSDYNGAGSAMHLRILLRKGSRNLNALDLFPNDPNVRALAARGRVLYLHQSSRTVLLLDSTTGVWVRRAY